MSMPVHWPGDCMITELHGLENFWNFSVVNLMPTSDISLLGNKYSEKR